MFNYKIEDLLCFDLHLWSLIKKMKTWYNAIKVFLLNSLIKLDQSLQLFN